MSSQSSGKRSSEFENKSKIGLTDEEVNKLNKNVGCLIDLCQWRNCNAENVPIGALAISLQEVAMNMSRTGCASTVDQSWLIARGAAERINLLPHQAILDLASMWVEARDKEEWECFCRASHLSDCRTSRQHNLVQPYFRLKHHSGVDPDANGGRGTARHFAMRL